MLSIREATIKDSTLLSQLLEISYRFHFSCLWNDKDELEAYIAQECSAEQISTSLQSSGHKWFIAEPRHVLNSETRHANIIGFSKIIFN
ncbi:hypothetical protein XNC1_4468 [Xenorhabdus nematophila ATCC 19061]|uniref:N-acetyltransferase domain-containing protein n=2 Tax=Xenorhabdus nematophila TaxID=628 RepID=D3VF33_XENNA|nr:hypothetical protein [Xenorhabdus nematophila]CBJ92490.1 hypothetical protein XNC1_4468 [Xenorhabdus nematophila ATCC 19061]